MTVKELIEKLQELPPDIEVTVGPNDLKSVLFWEGDECGAPFVELNA
jgi:hypothetical protein